MSDFVGALAGARAFCLVFGTGYLAFGVLGLVLGDPSTDYLLDVGLFSVSTPDHIHHLLIGTMILTGGILAPAVPSTAAREPGWTGRLAGRVWSMTWMAGDRREPTSASGAAVATSRFPMSRRAPLSPAARLTVVSLAVAAAGVVMMTISGVEFTTPIPPGLFILLVPAGLVAFGRWRWTPPIAALASLFIVVSYVPSGSLVRLFEPRPLGTFIGLWLQLVGAFVAAVAGTIAAVQGCRQRGPAA